GDTTNDRVQWLYFPNEFTPPLIAPGLITKIYIKIQSAGAATTYTNLKVLMGTTPQVVTTSTFFIGMQTCYAAPSTSFPAHVAGDWFEVTLQTPFFWNTVDNLVVEVSQEGYTAARSIVQHNPGGNR